MSWLVFSYSLPAQSRSSPRVTFWRRLKQLGVVTLAGGAQVLPDRETCDEAFRWLAQEVRQARGEAVLMRVEHFEGLGGTELIERFQAARAADYAELEPEIQRLERSVTRPDNRRLREALQRLRRKHQALSQIDYFESPAGRQAAARLAHLDQALAPAAPSAAPAVALADFQGKLWVTRPRPHVDRLACAWLIRRYIDPGAVIEYTAQPAPGAVTFDMEQADFGHEGERCSFETMRLRFGLDQPGLAALAEIVHDLDLHASAFRRPETDGVAAILDGWRLAGLDDAELEQRGLALIDGLVGSLAAQPRPVPRLSGQVGRP